MALGDAYSTPAEYREAMIKRDSGKDEDILADLLAISRYMEKKMHVLSWNKSDDVIDRYFQPAIVGNYPDGWAERENPWKGIRGDLYLHVDPIADITDMVVTVDTNRNFDYGDETAMQTSEYILYPRNALTGPEPLPYTELAKVDHSIWTPGAEVKITAFFGYPIVPKIVPRVCNQLTGLLRFESPRARAITEIEGTMEASRDAQQILYTLQMALKRQPGFGMS